ncbi:glycosyltransferase [Tahibacter harae]|uniref:Glycosyltransferase n=1 Tax=Tahibacter harae TaxID=2963937 RepID=A0ABT1QLX3_9GAMM|nr:glycosyltransferase [Tahibacter harae]MCQ4163531.1 glycosyltransferase [Tahibacter harae]
MSQPPPTTGAQRTAIIVAGMHRSGTSATTRIINLLGAQLARELIPADIGNERGHWESRAVQALHNRLLAALGSDLYSPVNFPAAWFDSAEAQQWTAHIRDLVAGEYPASNLFVLKDPRIALFLPLWSQALRQAHIVPRFVLPFRHPAAVAASLEARERRLASGDALPPAQGMAVWLRYVLAAEKFTRGELRSFVAFDALLADWRAEFARLGQQLAIDWPDWPRAEAAIDDFLDRGAGSRATEETAHDAAGIWHDVHAGLLRAVQAPQSEFAVFDSAAQSLAAAEALLGPSIVARERVFDDLRRRADAAAQQHDSERADMHRQFAVEIGLRDARIAEAGAHAAMLQQTLATREQERSAALDYARSLERERDISVGYAQALEQERDKSVGYAQALERERDTSRAYAQSLEQDRDRAAENAAQREREHAALQARLAAEIHLRDAQLAEAAAEARRQDDTVALLQREHGNASAYAVSLARDRDRAVEYARLLKESRDEALKYAQALEQARDEAAAQALAQLRERGGLPVFFTIASRNYLAYAITLMQSVAEHYPAAPRYLILADRDEGDAALDAAPFTTIAAEALALPDFAAFAFRYTIMEFNTAIKPYAFAHLRRLHPDAGIVYLDPDILVVAPLAEVEAAFAGGALAVLTPHLVDPVDDGLQPGERDILLSGTYNCGFVAIGAHEQADRLIAWWAERLEFGAFSDIAAGLFTDQKWIDLVPGLFPAVQVLRDKGYNLAYWNLSQRPVSRRGPHWYAGQQRLAFVHFSGVDLQHPAQFSKHQNRHTRATIGKLKPLYAEYLRRLAANGHAEHCGKPYAYGRFADGEPICAPVRAVYRRYFDKGRAQPQRDPFAMDRRLYDLPCEELPARADAPVTRLMYAVWKLRADLQQAFDLGQAAGRRGFIRWFARAAQAEMGIPARHLQAARDSLATYAADHAQDAVQERWRSAQGPAGRAASACLDLINWSCRFRPVLRFYALIPQDARNRVRRRLERMAGRPALAAATTAIARSTGGINLVGYAHGEFGVAEVLRRYAHALQGGGVPFVVRNFATGVASRQGDRSMQRFLSEECRYDVNLFCINADQMPVAREQLGDAVFAGRYNIGCWFWELEKFPGQWHGAIDIVDEIWVSSPFVRDAIAACTGKPVHIVPVALEVNLPGDCARSEFGLAEGVFLCLFSFDFNSFVVRKNAEGVIAAFRRAFADGRRDVRLLIKTTNGARFPQALQQLIDTAAADDRIEVRDGFLDRRGMWALQASCDCYVSLHRSEGLGLGMAECMLLGKPVVATAYSGNLAFMDADNSCLVDYSLIPVREGEYPAWQDQHWAEPDIEQAAAYLRRLADDPVYARQIGENARTSVSRRLSAAACLAAISARLTDIRSRRPG